MYHLMYHIKLNYQENFLIGQFMNYLGHYIRLYSLRFYFIEFSFSRLFRLANRTMNNSQAWYDWCNTHEPTIDVSEPGIESDACLWHINIHACSIGRSVPYCGPWYF